MLKQHSSRIPTRVHPHLYEINTWAWLTELSNREGRTLRLSDIPDSQWDGLREQGFDCIWLMGIWERSSRSRQIAIDDPELQKEYDTALPGWQPTDILGSPYAIRAYRPDPELASWDQLAMVLDKLHDRGMKLILDFVPNHTALDHDWVTTHPDYYVQGADQDAHDSPSEFFTVETQHGCFLLAHGKDPNFSAWTDTAQLNYFNPSTRRALIQELGTIAQYCDGVRCDMAMLVLNQVFAQTWGRYLKPGAFPDQEFWTQAISFFPDFVWIAEVYWNREWELQQLGFQYTYDKRLYDRLRHASPQEVTVHLSADVDYQRKLVRFLENHDEHRSAAIFGNLRFPAIGVVASTLPGMRLYHQGQLEGRRIRIPVQLRRQQEEPLDKEIMSFYLGLLRIINEEVFHTGHWQLLTISAAGNSSFENLIAYQWQTPTAWKIVVVNIGWIVARGFVKLLQPPDPPYALPQSWLLIDQLTNQAYTRNYEDLIHHGLYVELAAFGAHLFSVSSQGDP